MEKILNLSNHKLTEEQIEDLKKIYDKDIEIIELPEKFKKQWSNLNPDNYRYVCNEISDYIGDKMISVVHLAGFAPAIVYMIDINNYLVEEGDLEFIYAYSERVSEEKEVNGEIIKTSVFKHKGWYKYNSLLLI